MAERIELAHRFVPRLPGAPDGAWELSSQRGSPLRVTALEGPRVGLLIEYSVAEETWEELGSGLWRAERPLPSMGRASSADHAAQVLRGEALVPPLPGREWGFALSQVEPGVVPPQLAHALARAVETRAYFLHGPYVYLFEADGSRPSEYTVRDPALLGGEENGAWIVSAGSIRARGIPVLAGRAESVRADVPARSRLTFTALCQGAQESTDDEPALARIVVRMNGDVLLEHELPIAPTTDLERFSIDLPPTASNDAELTFAVEGPACLVAFLLPSITPIELVDERPDVIVFLADTYRADNIALSGGDPRIAPHVNRFGKESLAFSSARAPSSWTFPSHAAMFSALYPYQSGASARDRSLPTGAWTIAEHLSQAGYRTVAVTEGGYVSPNFGLAQGFEWFESGSSAIEQTLERAREQLDVPDERPLFLFVHTYRAHGPYVVGAAVRKRLGIEFTAAEIEALHSLPAMSAADEVTREQAAELISLYHGASAELDLGFGEFRRDLEQRGMFDDAFVVFTSDHGEAFFEHDVQGHGNGVWEEHVHVPLLIRGPGITPDIRDLPVGLVDLPRTLAALAGVPAHGAWLGENLLELDRERPAFVFQCSQVGLPDRMALVAHGRKVLLEANLEAIDADRVDFAYDLRVDPRERVDIADEAWTMQLLDAQRGACRAMFRPLLDSEAAEVSSEVEERLRALGYLGD